LSLAGVACLAGPVAALLDCSLATMLFGSLAYVSAWANATDALKVLWWTLEFQNKSLQPATTETKTFRTAANKNKQPATRLLI
jgi:hypothetical protein